LIPLLAIINAASRPPDCRGENSTLIVQFPLAAIRREQSFVILNSSALAPASLRSLITTGDAPWFLSVNPAWPDFPCSIGANVRRFVSMLSCDAGGGVGNGSGIPLMIKAELSSSLAIPVSLSSAAFCPVLLVTTSAASRDPTLTGEKTTLILQLPVGSSI